jgi:hypothetical protein
MSRDQILLCSVFWMSFTENGLRVCQRRNWYFRRTSRKFPRANLAPLEESKFFTKDVILRRQLTTSLRFIHGSLGNHQHKLERLRIDQSKRFMHVPGFEGQEDSDDLFARMCSKP